MTASSRNRSTVLGFDELLEIDPEPCEWCSTGIVYMLCHDGEWRCISCVREHARSMGWDDTLTESVSTEETETSEEGEEDGPVTEQLSF